MEFASTVDFARAARTLSRAVRRMGLDAPSYRCPPRIVGADRTIRRRSTDLVVAIRVKGRPRAGVLADMIEGVIVANGLVSPHADRVRTDLWIALERDTSVDVTSIGRDLHPTRHTHAGAA